MDPACVDTGDGWDPNGGGGGGGSGSGDNPDYEYIVEKENVEWFFDVYDSLYSSSESLDRIYCTEKIKGKRTSTGGYFTLINHKSSVLYNPLAAWSEQYVNVHITPDGQTASSNVGGRYIYERVYAGFRTFNTSGNKNFIFSNIFP